MLQRGGGALIMARQGCHRQTWCHWSFCSWSHQCDSHSETEQSYKKGLIFTDKINCTLLDLSSVQVKCLYKVPKVC